ncbi:MAG: hypothetical protein BIFFINMI_00425 [Phycisphaerae bacterium]|nr:hypothetical protein [Phycisphaerae bacterium]
MNPRVLTMRLLGVIALAATAALAGCQAVAMSTQPMYSSESIYADHDRDPDPAISTPYLEPGAPGGEEMPATAVGGPAATSGSEIKPPPGPVYTTMDPVTDAPGFRVWIDGNEPAVTLGSRSGQVAWDISPEPSLKFALRPQMGTFRAATIQIYRIVGDRLDVSSGVTITEPGEPAVLTPEKEIFLPRPGGRVVIRHAASGQVLPWYTLANDAQYEIQIVIGGTKEPDALSVRVHTVPKGRKPGPPPTTQPEGPSGEETPRLPPGVIIPDLPKD